MLALPAAAPLALTVSGTTSILYGLWALTLNVFIASAIMLAAYLIGLYLGESEIGQRRGGPIVLFVVIGLAASGVWVHHAWTRSHTYDVDVVDAQAGATLSTGPQVSLAEVTYSLLTISDR